uniref:Uncharacterized protein n=1 Tax=Tanacetum cinerariifolium TaxID=118510 RepID=A0A6L2N5Z9_TANCI|nr:hypothetical protein [Tanacetum cinerariifolium]
MRMEKWAMLVTYHMFVYILKDATSVRWNNLSKGVVTNYEDSKRRLQTHFKQQKKQTKTHLVGVKIKSLVKFISKELSESYDGLMEKTYSWIQAEETTSNKKPITFMDSAKMVGKTFTKPPKMVSKIRDASKYYEFHQDYGHGTHAYIELKNKTKEAVKSRKWAYLIKGIKKGRAKQADNQLEEWTAPAMNADLLVEGKEETIFMIRVTNNPIQRKKLQESRV